MTRKKHGNEQVPDGCSETALDRLAQPNRPPETTPIADAAADYPLKSSSCVTRSHWGEIWIL